MRWQRIDQRQVFRRHASTGETAVRVDSWGHDVVKVEAFRRLQSWPKWCTPPSQHQTAPRRSYNSWRPWYQFFTVWVLRLPSLATQTTKIPCATAWSGPVKKPSNPIFSMDRMSTKRSGIDNTLIPSCMALSRNFNIYQLLGRVTLQIPAHFIHGQFLLCEE